MAEGKGYTPSLTGQENYMHYSRLLFILIGSVRRQKKDDGIVKLLLKLSKYATVHHKQPGPIYFLNSPFRGSPDGDLTNAPAGKSPDVMGVSPEIPSFTPSMPEAAEPSTSTTLPTRSLPSRAELAMPPTITHDMKTPHLSTSLNGTNETEDAASYTMVLKEIGDEDGRYGVYVEERVNFEPPWWKCTVTFREVQGVGEGSKKRTAKHKASRSAYLQLGYPALP